MRSGLLGIVAFLWLAGSSTVGLAADADRPNVLLILADDLGWRDVGYNGSEILTPNLDRLAREGVRLNRYYSQPSCSPTRASLMTGMAASRTGIYQPIDKNLTNGLPQDITLMPGIFRRHGYRTALVGKWHLGHAYRDQLPNARGFDSAYGNFTGGVGYWDHVHGGALDWHRDGVALREPGYATHLQRDEAVAQLRAAEKAEPRAPVFMLLSFSAPHLPNEAPAEVIAAYPQTMEERRRLHAAMVSEMDRAIGDVMQALRDSGMYEDTLVWFMSDNGGLAPAASVPKVFATLEWLTQWIEPPWGSGSLEFARSNLQDGGADNHPLRRGKGSVYEGGIRVPSLVYWPGQLSPRLLEQRIVVQDVLPTVLEATSIVTDEAVRFDGASRWQSLLSGAQEEATNVLVTGLDGEALLAGQWKLVCESDGSEALFDLLQDPGETDNLIDSKPDVADELRGVMAHYPRAVSIHDNSALAMFLDPDSFGGREVRKPWADRVRD